MNTPKNLKKVKIDEINSLISTAQYSYRNVFEMRARFIVFCWLMKTFFPFTNRYICTEFHLNEFNLHSNK
jgi:hypothetical protein